jgi:hypothetical protein
MQIALLGESFLGEVETISFPAHIGAKSLELRYLFGIERHAPLRRNLFLVSTPDRALDGAMASGVIIVAAKLLVSFPATALRHSQATTSTLPLVGEN